MIETLTPILLVDAIAPVLPFYERLGFTLLTSVPDAPPYDFAMLTAAGDTTLMLQTRASAAADAPRSTEGVNRAILYLRVGAIDAVLAALADAPVVVPRRTTFYGADEIFVHDPAGHVIGLAAFPERQDG